MFNTDFIITKGWEPVEDPLAHWRHPWAGRGQRVQDEDHAESGQPHRGRGHPLPVDRQTGRWSQLQGHRQWLHWAWGDFCHPCQLQGSPDIKCVAMLYFIKSFWSSSRWSVAWWTFGSQVAQPTSSGFLSLPIHFQQLRMRSKATLPMSGEYILFYIYPKLCNTGFLTFYFYFVLSIQYLFSN